MIRAILRWYWRRMALVVSDSCREAWVYKRGVQFAGSPLIVMRWKRREAALETRNSKRLMMLAGSFGVTP